MLPFDDYSETPLTAGQQIGEAASNHVQQRAEDYCASERRRIDLQNEPMIRALKAAIADRQELESDFKNRILHAIPPGDEQNRKRKSRFCWAVFLILFAAGFALSVVTVQPFRFGWVSWLFCGGVAICVAFMAERMLQVWASRNLIRGIVTVGFVAGLLGLLFMADIRAERFAEEQRQADSAVLTMDDSNPSPATQDNFFDRTTSTLRLAMKLLALAMELAAGVALYEALRHSPLGENREQLRNRLSEIREEMIAYGSELWRLENEGAEFEAQFWRDFYRALLRSTIQRAKQRVAMIMAIALATIILMPVQRVSASTGPEVVVILDLSKSETAADTNQISEFKKNVDGVAHVLANLPAGAHITVLGATANSFSQPVILLQAKLSSDEGYFKERLGKAHAQLLSAWSKQSSNLQPDAKQTDLLGVLVTASEIFEHVTSVSPKWLIIYSDMRNSTSVVDFERQRTEGTGVLVDKVADAGLLPPLSQVKVQVLGADAVGKSVKDWQILKKFWAAYFRKAGAILISYSNLRFRPVLY